eukprot:6671805-Lingulodinium_polyedra.AAC.1
MQDSAQDDIRGRGPLEGLFDPAALASADLPSGLDSRAPGEDVLTPGFSKSAERASVVVASSQG